MCPVLFQSFCPRAFSFNIGSTCATRSTQPGALCTTASVRTATCRRTARRHPGTGTARDTHTRRRPAGHGKTARGWQTACLLSTPTCLTSGTPSTGTTSGIARDQSVTLRCPAAFLPMCARPPASPGTAAAVDQCCSTLRAGFGLPAGQASLVTQKRFFRLVSFDTLTPPSPSPHHPPLPRWMRW